MLNHTQKQRKIQSKPRVKFNQEAFISGSFCMIVYNFLYIHYFFVKSNACTLYIEDITRWCEDMNFIFEWQNNILQMSTASD